ncbi:MAG: hypothetical protein CVU50_00305 [Candidatus Cloacimonetes bacterium HGW-Cloacimonetes-3]|nr:MAG: hypothetical protein CVU50_00305 [Candidatus Cloacimonetes bacterium HGW-Cloacimonetes-3]
MTNKNSSPKAKKLKQILIIILIVIVLVLIGIFVPRYNRYMKSKRSAEAIAALDAIRKVADVYIQTNGSMEGFTLANAIGEANLSKKTIKNWKLLFVWKTPEEYNRELSEKLKISPTADYVPMVLYKVVIAIATKDNSAGEGKKVWYDGIGFVYHGYGVDDLVEPDWTNLFPDRYK